MPPRLIQRTQEQLQSNSNSTLFVTRFERTVDDCLCLAIADQQEKNAMTRPLLNMPAYLHCQFAGSEQWYGLDLLTFAIARYPLFTFHHVIQISVGGWSTHTDRQTIFHFLHTKLSTQIWSEHSSDIGFK